MLEPFVGTSVKELLINVITGVNTEHTQLRTTAMRLVTRTLIVQSAVFKARLGALRWYFKVFPRV